MNVISSAAHTPRFVETFAAPLGLRNEAALFERFCRQTAPIREIHLWAQSRCLVTTAGVAHRPEFEMAAALSARRGWPVHIRRSGGTTVFHSSGVLCASFLTSYANPTARIDAAYVDFTGPIIAALARIGIDATIGHAPHAPCDGRFNLLVGTRKLAGTAMRQRMVAGRLCVLGHAAFFIDGKVDGGLRAVETFERALGLPSAYAPAACIGIGDVIAPQYRAAPMDAVASALFSIERSVGDEGRAHSLAREHL